MVHHSHPMASASLLPAPSRQPILGAMRARLVVGGIGAAALAVVAGLWLARGGSSHPATRTAGAPAPTRATDHAPGSTTPAGHRGVLRRPAPTPTAPAGRTGAVTVGGVTLEGAGVFDPESDDVKANLLEFRKSRLRFALYDAAAGCWAGGDELADLQVAYTLVVEQETLRLEGVRMVDSTLPDPALERCILGQLVELRTPAAGIPDLREDGSSWISLHDLYTRNRRGR